MMGVALFLVWSKTPLDRASRLAFIWFGIQLALNILWTAAFYGWRSEAMGYLLVCLLWLAILATMWTVSRVSKTATLLLVPYFLWVTFASCLNWVVLSLNVVKPNTLRLEAAERQFEKQKPRP